MEIKMTDEQLRSLLSEAIFDKIPEAERKGMLTSALTELMKQQENRNGFGGWYRASKLQEAVESALMKFARGIIEEMLTAEDIGEKVRVIVREAFEKVFVTDREQTKERISLAMADALAKSAER